MMLPTKFIERETGLEVLVSTPQEWRGYPLVSLIQYPNGMVYAIPDKDIGLYFEIVRPQNVQIAASGGTPYERPLAKQVAMREQAERFSIT